MNTQYEVRPHAATGKAIGHLILDLAGESANRFNAALLADLAEMLKRVESDAVVGKIHALVLRSGKDSFMMGADITEFLGHFKKSDAEMTAWLHSTHQIFNRLEDLAVPTVCAITGFALGGGCEVALACDFRIADAKAKIGLPETKLGIFPGWGGTVRLPRMVGVDNAVEWIASGKHYGADEAIKVGVIDAVVPSPATLIEQAEAMAADAATGKLAWKPRRARKVQSLGLRGVETTMAFESCKAFVGAQALPHYPAPMAAIESIERGAKLGRAEAGAIEIELFVKIARTPQAKALVSIFLADQAAKRQAKKAAKSAKPVPRAAVLGAGIMGGGIAYQSASSKVPVVMKDIKVEQLDLGMGEASKLLAKQVERGKLTAAKLGETLSRITPTLDMAGLKGVPFVVEAVVENERVKSQVLAEVEAVVDAEAVIASNTSTISISRLAKSLKHPERFCGMHFFNPVHRMPLVEVIRGEKSSPEAIATTVAYASTMGKTAIVVGDCPGFLVNRILFPYFGGFALLMRDGVPFERIDKVMEKFGWPMGPAYLLDVVGIDTAVHAQKVMSEGFPDRMRQTFDSAVDLQFKAGRFGQKNGKGFYNYTQDPKGRPVKAAGPEVAGILAPGIVSKGGGSDVTDEEIVLRMMLPMVFEASRCLEEKIAESPADVDLSVVYGLGFPPFRGGIFRWVDQVGVRGLVEAGERLSSLSPLYAPSAQFKRLANENQGFYAD